MAPVTAVKSWPRRSANGRKGRTVSDASRASTLTAKGTNSPRSASTTCSAIVWPAWSWASTVEAPRCGVTTTFGRPKSGDAVVGSLANTSRAAPATRPSATASARASSSRIPPRAVFTMRMPGFTLARTSRPNSPTVSGVFGRWTVRKSARPTRSSTVSIRSTPSWRARSAEMNGS